MSVKHVKAEGHVFSQNYFGEGRQPDHYTKEEAEVLFDGTYRYRVAFKQFILNLPTNARVLDAGCGVGKLIRLVQALRSDVTVIGIDITDMRAFLPKGVAFQQLSVEEIDQHFPAGHFDAIVCFHVLEHLLYPMRTMECFRTLLKNDGVLYLELPNWARMLMPFSSKFFWNDYSHVRPFARGSIKRLAKDYHFTVEQVHTTVSERTLRARIATFFLPDILFAILKKTV